MILVTGGTGFVGRYLTRHLVDMGKSVRILLRPSRKSPNLPISTPVDVAVCSLEDERGLRGALKGVDVVYHFIGSERVGYKANFSAVDINGTQAVVEAAAKVGVQRIFYLSHIGADRASAYPLLKAKAIAEGLITHSGINYTIFRSAPIFGLGDHFFASLARLIKMSPGIFLMPGEGNTLIQPIWIEDLVTCMAWAGEDRQSYNQIYTVGGVEYLKFSQIIEMILQTLSLHRLVVNITPAYLRIISLIIENFYPGLPVSSFLLDYLSTDRTAPLDTLPRQFGIIPARLGEKINYLKERKQHEKN
jgi:uncharacterized protein YbjT (DUF2867 family)